MRELPKVLRFVRALALVGGLGAAACGDDAKSGDATDVIDTVDSTVADAADTTVADTADTADTSVADTADTSVADTLDTNVADTVEDTAAVDCDACSCAEADASSACIQNCCIAVGPLAPPDLPVSA